MTQSPHSRLSVGTQKTAKLKYPQAAIEDLDSRSTRGLERSAVMSLALGEWVKCGHAVLITGATGAGKSWLACALAQHACRRGHSALYLRVPRLGEELRIRHANGTFTRWLDTLKNTDVLVLDDWGMAAMDSQTRADLLEIIDDRASHRATVISSQLPIEHWHEWIGDQTMADAMLDRLMQNHHRFTLTGESLRKKSPPAKAPRVTIVVASLEPRTRGAAMKDICGTLRTIIQRPGSRSAVAA